MLVILVWLKKVRPILKLPSLKWMIELELLSIRIFLVKVILKIGQEKYFLSILLWKLILGLIKFKERKNMKMNFYEKELLLSEL